MRRSEIDWPRALRALAVALALVCTVVFVAGNFVVVEVRVFGVKLRTRLGWAVVVPAALAFAAGLAYGRARARQRPRPATPASE